MVFRFSLPVTRFCRLKNFSNRRHDIYGKYFRAKAPKPSNDVIRILKTNYIIISLDLCFFTRISYVKFWLFAWLESVKSWLFSQNYCLNCKLRVFKYYGKTFWLIGSMSHLRRNRNISVRSIRLNLRHLTRNTYVEFVLFIFLVSVKLLQFS